MNFDLPLNIDRYYLTLVLRAISHTVFFHRSFMLTKPVEVNIDFMDLTYVMIRVDDPEIERMIDDKIVSFLKILDSSFIGPAPSSTSSSTPYKNTPASSSTASTPHNTISSSASTVSLNAAALIKGAAGVLSGVGGAVSGSTSSNMVSGGASGSPHSFILSFSERKQKKAQGWFSNEPAVIPWEQWTIRLVITQSKTERDQLQAKKSIEQQLHSTLLKITQIANDHKDHVPAITTQDSYPFPMQISFSSDQSWGGIIKTLINTSTVQY
ncbi:autophagy-related protein [Obelidium mucronatum]|nr:autophagy-related protein [Obelidium mucronatum]